MKQGSNVYATLGASNHSSGGREGHGLYCTHPDAVIDCLSDYVEQGMEKAYFPNKSVFGKFYVRKHNGKYMLHSRGGTIFSKWCDTIEQTVNDFILRWGHDVYWRHREDRPHGDCDYFASTTTWFKWWHDKIDVTKEFNAYCSGQYQKSGMKVRKNNYDYE